MRITADAAYDTVAVYETAGARGATVVIPPARTGTYSLCDRNGASMALSSYRFVVLGAPRRMTDAMTHIRIL